MMMMICGVVLQFRNRGNAVERKRSKTKKKGDAAAAADK